jgi:hypothetical protein
LYPYSGTSSTTTLHHHITRDHLQQYIEHCKKNGRHIDAQILAKGLKSGADMSTRMTPFTEQAFRSALLSFIVANDIVSLSTFLTI